jgi:peptide/nickel transport system permease protein
MRLSPYVLLWPALVIAIAVLAFNILGDVIRDRLDPRLR